ncbi:hypothetical protein [Rhizobium sp. RHZ01]|uniref:hypothetical protein n=1 Tax=Rhizobium sp. RHZ01 TaxID=2769304 RepID=UPI001AEF1981|nr:hypothetical protein [Rhizobium sp. RHZ01]
MGIGVVWANLNNTVDDLKQTQRELADRFDREALDRKERQKIYQVTMDGMNTQIGQIAPLQYQQSQMLEKVSENKTSIAQTSGLIASLSPSAVSWIRSSTPSTRSLPEERCCPARSTSQREERKVAIGLKTNTPPGGGV